MNPEKQNTILIREKLAEARHNETISEIGAFTGLAFIALTAFTPAIGFLLLAGLALIFSGAAASFYYNRKQQRLLKQLVVECTQ